MPFDPTPHLTNKVKGGGLYLEVKYRLMWLREDFPASEIETEMVQLDLDQKLAIFRARVSIPEHGAATGYGSETERDFPAGWIEKAETKAVGRALAALGFGTQFALELDEGGVADSPVPAKPKAAAPAPRPTPPPASTAATPAQERPANIRDLAATIPDTRTLAREETQARATDGQVVMERRRDGTVALNNVPLGEDGTAMFEALRKAMTLDALGKEWTAVVANRTALSAPQLDILIRWKENRKVELEQPGVAL